jgi:hypothetical protein
VSAAPRTGARTGRAWLALWLLAVAVGAWLRLDQLGIQILIDDEWHALHKLLTSGAGDIATHFGRADYSIPLTLYDLALARLGVLCEWSLRAPSVLAGVALVVTLPLLLRRWSGAASASIAAALLAISPLHVHASRTARPYALVCLLALVALVAFRRWWTRDPRAPAWAAAYVATTVLAGWLHLLSLAFTLTPFVGCGAGALRAAFTASHRREAWTMLWRLVAIGLATAVPLAVVLVPPLAGDWRALVVKAGAGVVTWEGSARALPMLFGVASWPPAIVLALAAIGGYLRLRRRERAFADSLALAIVLGTALVLASRPAWIQHQGVVARYCIAALPILLWFVAEGIAGAVAPLRGGGLQVLAAGAAIAALFAIGPLPRIDYRPNQFMGHARFVFDYDPRHNGYMDPATLPGDPVPAFYRELARRPPRSLTIVEAPWRLESNYIPDPWYQRIHRQYVKPAFVDGVCGAHAWGEIPRSASGICLANYVRLGDLLDGDTAGLDYLVVRPRPWTIPASARDATAWPDMRRCLPRIEARFGPPVYRDAQILVFDLHPGEGHRD